MGPQSARVGIQSPPMRRTAPTVARRPARRFQCTRARAERKHAASDGRGGQKRAENSPGPSLCGDSGWQYHRATRGRPARLMGAGRLPVRRKAAVPILRTQRSAPRFRRTVDSAPRRGLSPWAPARRFPAEQRPMGPLAGTGAARPHAGGAAMKTTRRRCWRWLALGVLTLPLLATSCVDVAQSAVIDGFFDAVIPLLNEMFAAWLGGGGASLAAS